MLKLNAAIIIPCVLVLSLLAPYVMRIYGRDYKDAWPTLVVLLITSGIYALLTPVGEIIAAAGQNVARFCHKSCLGRCLDRSDCVPRSLGFVWIRFSTMIAYSLHAIWTFCACIRS